VPGPNERVVGGERSLQVILGVLLIGLTAITAFVVSSSTIGIAVVDERLDLIINTGATLAALAIAALAWARFKITREGFAFAQVAAFLTLGTLNGLVLMSLTLNRGAELGFSLDNPGPMPVISFVLARFVAAAVLLVGGIAALRRTTLRPRWGALIVMAPAVLTVVGLSILRRTDPPNPLTPEALEQLQRLPRQPLELSTISPGLFAVQVVIGLMFLGAAWFAYRTTIRDERPADGYLAIGLILAAFSQVHFALNPGAYAGLMTTGDLLRIGFYVALLAGVLVQSRSDVRRLEEANVELRRLRDAEVNRALLEERARLAREVHDGLAQDLWTARLKQGRLVQQLADEEHRALAQDVVDAIDAGLADARQTVMAMRAGSTDAPLMEIAERYLQDFGDRYALDVRFERDGDVPPLPARTQAELLRIVQEALNNVRKHADATVVRLRASVEDGGLQMTVMDNGRGFDPGTTPPGDGLTGMRERADLIGARLEFESSPSDGTCVRVHVPIPGGGR
jgi:signal transduction histidine kinase